MPSMTVSTSGSVTSADADRIIRGARLGGASGHRMRFATFAATHHVRGTRTLLALGSGWRIPMSTRIVEQGWLSVMVAPEVATALAKGGVAMGRTAAEVRGARAGDVLTLRTSRFARRDVTVAAVVDDHVVGWNDLLMSSTTAATKFGAVRIAGVSIIGMSSPTKVVAGLKRAGIVPGTRWRLRTSWDAPDPDATLGHATVKKLFGEVPYRPTGGAGLEIDRTWALSNISWLRRYRALPLRNNCHSVVAAAFEKALSAIVEAGLGDEIDVRNSNRYGGCYTGRFNRLGGAYASLSRHALGIAIDLNPSTNPMWAEPTLDCALVWIMREHGFAWGGNFWPADGMHFEWVGEPRHEIGSATGRCRNRVPVPTTSLPDFGASSTTVVPTTTIESTTTTTVPQADSSPTTTDTATTLPPDTTVTTSSVPLPSTSTSVASGS